MLNEEQTHEDIAFVIGTTDGSLYMFDPIIRGRIDIKKFTHEFEQQIASAKRKSVEIVRWLEKSPTRPHSSRFLVVYSDGMLAIYHKDRDVPSAGAAGAAYEPEKDMIKVGGGEVSRLQLLKRMRGFVEDYNFEESPH